MKKKKPNIETDTPIIPDVVAESRLEEVIAWLHANGHKKQAAFLYKHRHKIENHLVETLNTIYEHNEKFRAKLKRIQRIDQLNVWIEHWLASYLNQNFYSIFRLLPRGYGWDVRLTQINPISDRSKTEIQLAINQKHKTRINWGIVTKEQAIKALNTTHGMPKAYFDKLYSIARVYHPSTHAHRNPEG